LKKPHRFAGYKLSVTTNLDRATIADIARQAGDSAKGNAFNSPGRSRFEEATADRLTFSVRDRIGREMMTYSLQLSDADGGSKFTVSINSYKQMQQKFWGLIPIGPKRLLGLAAYKDFIAMVQSNVVARDPNAVATITGA
jgi:hypothetical protein